MGTTYRVVITGPENGKPQKGESVWLEFVHPDQDRASALGDAIARRLRQETGHDVVASVTPLLHVPNDEIELARQVDELAKLYGPSVTVDGVIVDAAATADGMSLLYDDDARMEEISADAEDAAVHAWGPPSNIRRRSNPHVEGSEEATFWESVFTSAYARENGR